MSTTWIFSDEEFGYPYIEEAGLAEKANPPSLWIYAAEDEDSESYYKEFDYPYIKLAGLAEPYKSGFSKLYLGADNVQVLYTGNINNKKAYLGEIEVFNKL